MRYGTDTLTSHQNWERLYALPYRVGNSPFFSKAYYNSYIEVEKAEVECFWAYQDECNYLFYPYLRKAINQLGYDLPSVYYDVSGAYGYNGPIGMAKDQGFLSLYNSNLKKHFQDSAVVTEFVRFCPITDNRHFHTYTDQVDVLDNVYIDLSKGLDAVWNESFEYRVRKSICKGENYGLKTELLRGTEITEDALHIFFKIYNSTMQRNEADRFYFFDYGFFTGLRDKLGEMLLLSITYLKDTPISTELILIGGVLAFGFLGGTLSEYYQYKANTFQRWELLKYLEQQGIQKYSMGGGATRGDSIYKFKMSFAKGCNNPFYIGTKVHNPSVYDQIVNQWQAKYPESYAKYSGRIQGYRMIDLPQS